MAAGRQTLWRSSPYCTAACLDVGNPRKRFVGVFCPEEYPREKNFMRGRGA